MEVPPCLMWSAEEVAEWISSIGFPQYTECFTANIVHGRKLIWVESARSLPKLGITDWKHIQAITSEVRTLLNVSTPNCRRSVTQPYRCQMGIFLERKGRSGTEADKLTLQS